MLLSFFASGDGAGVCCQHVAANLPIANILLICVFLQKTFFDPLPTTDRQHSFCTSDMIGYVRPKLKNIWLPENLGAVP